MRPSSAKSKGRRLQQATRDLLLQYAPELEPDDIRSTSMGAGGEDLLLSPAARKIYPLSFECKNQESLAIWQALEQAATNAKNSVPCLVFKRNKTTTYIALEFEEFLKLIRK